MIKKEVVLLITVLCMTLMGCAKNPSEEGVKYLKKGQYKEAEAFFEEAIKTENNVGDAYRGIGLSKWEQGSYEEAKAAFESALENGTEKTGTLYNLLGNCEMRLDNVSGALNYYRLAIEAKDNSEALAQEVKFNMIAAYEKQGDWESAKLKLREYVAEYPEDEEAQKESKFLETR